MPSAGPGFEQLIVPPVQHFSGASQPEPARGIGSEDVRLKGSQRGGHAIRETFAAAQFAQAFLSGYPDAAAAILRHRGDTLIGKPGDAKEKPAVPPRIHARIAARIKLAAAVLEQEPNAGLQLLGGANSRDFARVSAAQAASGGDPKRAVRPGQQPPHFRVEQPGPVLMVQDFEVRPIKTR